MPSCKLSACLMHTGCVGMHVGCNNAVCHPGPSSACRTHPPTHGHPPICPTIMFLRCRSVRSTNCLPSWRALRRRLGCGRHVTRDCGANVGQLYRMAAFQLALSPSHSPPPPPPPQYSHPVPTLQYIKKSVNLVRPRPSLRQGPSFRQDALMGPFGQSW